MKENRESLENWRQKYWNKSKNIFDILTSVSHLYSVSKISIYIIRFQCILATHCILKFAVITYFLMKILSVPLKQSNIYISLSWMIYSCPRVEEWVNGIQQLIVVSNQRMDKRIDSYERVYQRVKILKLPIQFRRIQKSIKTT